jgi:hypothetical protein
MGRFCCKSPGLPYNNFLAKRRVKLKTSVDVPLLALPTSPVTRMLSQVFPHIFFQKPHLRLLNLELNDAGRLLQQYRPGADISAKTNTEIWRPNFNF